MLMVIIRNKKKKVVTTVLLFSEHHHRDLDTRVSLLSIRLSIVYAHVTSKDFNRHASTP